MDFENESISESEDETDTFPLQYQEVDSSLLGTAVFIKNVQIEPGEIVLLYVHSQVEEAKRPDIKLVIIVFGVLVTFSSMIVLSF
ncbi:hypothetical protein SteCoe_12012 [Stentor coeruleus]|uniref:Uncharacterized protein n=1 Tax=Stentor coeruleus TaxID=5963 RepID=A0A1R2CBQ8_9CILI|nr:hypothetical protein SteCoe_12012 [Stentor coeruleus]